MVVTSRRHAALSLDPSQVYYLYLGRRAPIKGFDVVLESFQNAYRTDPSLRLLLVGRGEPVQSPGVVDIGYSEDPASWLAACDYLVSANRQSYFDLSVMEALSLGTPMIIACTGGHRYFADAHSPGIVPLHAVEGEALTRSFLAHRTKRSENAQGSEGNRAIYRSHFSDSAYRDRLDCLLERLLSGAGRVESRNANAG